MIQPLSTFRKTRLIALSSFILVLSCISFLFPSIASAQTLQSGGQITYTILGVNGQKHVYKVPLGQDLVVPIGNGTSTFRPMVCGKD
jgi:hypothetical protein